MASTHATRSESPSERQRRASGEDGFGLIEVIVAMVLMVIGVLSGFIASEASHLAGGRGERLAAVGHHAESEIERIEALPYASVGMKTLPTNSGSGKATDPLNYVTSGPAGYKYDWLQPTSQPAATRGR